MNLQRLLNLILTARIKKDEVSALMISVICVIPHLF